MAKILVLGAGGFIGSHLVKRLKRDGHWVRGVDLKVPQYGDMAADDFVIGEALGWAPDMPLADGLERTCRGITAQVAGGVRDAA